MFESPLILQRYILARKCLDSTESNKDSVKWESARVNEVESIWKGRMIHHSGKWTEIRPSPSNIRSNRRSRLKSLTQTCLIYRITYHLVERMLIRSNEWSIRPNEPGVARKSFSSQAYLQGLFWSFLPLLFLVYKYPFFLYKSYAYYGSYLPHLKNSILYAFI